MTAKLSLRLLSVCCVFSMLVSTCALAITRKADHAGHQHSLAPTTVEPSEALPDDLPRDMRNPDPSDGSMLVDNSDPCETYSGCGECNQDPRCGWCAANAKCMVGGPEGPKLAKCAAWSKEFCEAESCATYKSCMGCLADPYCGWCPGEGEDEEGTCMEGSGGGPTDGTCDASWAHSPVRKGTNYKTASVLDATHKAYLREVCESPTKKIGYAKPPPDNSVPPSAKVPEILSIVPKFGPNFGSTLVTITGRWYGFMPNNQTVFVGDRPCTSTTWRSESVLECVTPPAKNTLIDQQQQEQLMVENNMLFSKITNGEDTTFSYRPMKIKSVSPMHGPTEGGTILTITGENFGYKDHSPEVFVGKYPCMGVQWMSPTTIQCATAPGVGDDNEVTMVIEGTKAISEKLLFVFDLPEILSITGTSSPTVGNRTFTIYGKNFGTSASRPVITVGGVPCMFQRRISHAEMECSTPPGVGREKRVVVASGHRYSRQIDFVINYDPPVIASITPKHGPTTGGYAVSIRGANFGTGAYAPVLTFRPDAWLIDVLGRASATYTTDRNPSWGAWANITGAAGGASATHNTSVYKLLPRRLPEEVLNTTNETAAITLANMTVLQNEEVRSDIEETVRSAATSSAVNALQAVARTAIKISKPSNDQDASKCTGCKGKNDVTGMISAVVSALKTVKAKQKDGAEVDARVVADSVGSTIGGGGYGDGNGGVHNGHASRRRRLLAMEESVKESSSFAALQSVLNHIEKTAPSEHYSRLAKALVFMDMESKAGGYGAKEHNVDGGYGEAIVAELPMANKTSNETSAIQIQAANLTNTSANVTENAIPESIVPVEKSEEFTKVCSKGQGNDYTAAGLECIEVFIGGRACREVKMLSDSELECTAPDFIGANLSVVVIVGNQSTMLLSTGRRAHALMDLPDHVEKSEKVLFSYDPPVVSHMFPDVGPTTGNITVTFKGINFGTRDWEKEIGHQSPLAITVGGQNCLNSLWVSDSVVECLLPPGAGTRHKVFLTVAGQTYPPPGGEPMLFSYAGPELLSVFPAHGATDGMYDIVLTGRNFGTKFHLPNVFVDGVPCTSVKWVSDTVIKCLVPPGHGKDKSVVVWTGDQHSRLDNDWFSYEVPEVNSIVPNTCLSRGGCKVLIKGRNFGHEQGEHISIMIGDYKCKTIGRGDQPLWLNHHTLECFVPEGVGGKLNVKVTVSGQVSLPNDYFSFGLPTVNSVLPRHGTCDGGNIVNITGTNFGMTDSKPIAYIKGKKCEYTKWISDSKLVCKTPKGFGSDVKVKVQISNQFSDDRKLLPEAHFEYDPPEIYSISSNNGPAVGSKEIIVTGINLSPDATVVFKDMDAVGGKYIPCKTTTWESYETLKCSTPGGISTKHTVHIQSGGKIFVQTKIPGAKSIAECPDPVIPRDASIDGTNRFEGAFVVYTCKPGYKIVGTALRTCLKGMWTGVEPVCEPPLQKTATPIYAEAGRMGVNQNDVAPEGTENAALSLSQKIAKAALEKQEIDNQMRIKSAKQEEQMKIGEQETEQAKKRTDKARESMDLTEKENKKVQAKLANLTEQVRVEQEESMKKTMEEFKKNKEKTRKGNDEAEQKRFQKKAAAAASAEPANMGEPEMDKTQLDVEDKRLKSMAAKEKSARELAQTYEQIKTSTKMKKMYDQEVDRSENSLKEVKAAGAPKAQRMEAEASVRKAKYDQNEELVILKKSENEAKELEAILKEDIPFVKTNDAGTFLRGEFVSIMFAPAGVVKPSNYDIFSVSKYGDNDGTRGTLNFDQAESACKVFGGTLAFPAMMSAARISGYARCVPGWVANGDAYTITRAVIPGCLAQKVGVAVFKVDKADAFCTLAKKPKATAFLEESTSLVPALSSFDAATGKLFRNYYDESSKEGQTLDENVYYMVSKKMVIPNPEFNYDKPEVHSISPQGGRTRGGDIVTIEGVNFGPMDALVGKKVFAEFFVLEGSDGVGWVKCRKTTYVKDGKIKCVTPSGIGTHNEVRVTIGGQTSDVTGSYDYGGPVILSANLAEGSPAGAYWLILEGENFGTSKKTFDEAHTFVTVQGTKARGIKYKDNEHVEILMPAGVGSDVPIVMEKVANGGSNSLPSTKTARLKPFKFFRPKIHTISPTHLPSIGGVIKIEGNNFGDPEYKEKPTVYVNGVKCEIRHKDDYIIDATVPAGIGGGLDVAVHLGDQRSVANTLFSFDAPVIHALSKLHGPATGGYDLDITGDNFGNSLKVEQQGKKKYQQPVIRIGSELCTNVKRKSNNAMRCTVNSKPAMGKLQNVVVTVGDQRNPRHTDAKKLFTIDPPIVKSVSPTLLTSDFYASSRQITINGDNFGTWDHKESGAILAGFGSSKCASTKRVSNNVIRCTLARDQRQSNPLARNNDDTWTRPWVIVGRQQSYNPLVKKVEKFYEMQYLKYADRDMDGSAMKTIMGSIDKCNKVCSETDGCVGYVRKGQECSLRDQTSLKLCGSKGITTGVDVYLLESISSGDLKYCHSERDVRFKPEVIQLSRNTGSINGNEWVTIVGENFGNKGSNMAKAAEAYVGPLNSDKCLKTIWVSSKSLKCLTPPNELGAGVVFVDDDFDGPEAPRADMWEPAGPNTNGRVGTDVIGSGAGRSLQFDNVGLRVATTRPLDLRFGGYVSFTMKWGDNFGKDYAVGLQYARDGKHYQTISTYPGKRRVDGDDVLDRRYDSSFKKGFTEVVASIGGRGSSCASCTAARVRFVMMKITSSTIKILKNKKKRISFVVANSCGGSTKNTFAIDNVVLRSNQGGGKVRVKVDQGINVMESNLDQAPVFKYDSDGLADASLRKYLSVDASKSMEGTEPIDALKRDSKNGWIAEMGKGVHFTISLKKPILFQVLRLQQLDKSLGCGWPSEISVTGKNNNKVVLSKTIKIQKKAIPVPYKIGTVQVEEVSVEVKAHHFQGKKCSGFKLLQVRGDLLDRLTDAGVGYSQCIDYNPFSGATTCKEAFTQGNSQSWITRGEGYGAQTKTIFTKRFKVQELRMEQLEHHRIKTVELQFEGGSKQLVTLKDKDGVQSIPIQSSPVTDYVKLVVKSTYGTKIPRNTWSLRDALRRENLKQWVYPSKNEKLTYGFGSNKMWGINSSMWFTGNAENLAPVRSVKRFPVTGGTFLSVRLAGSGEICSDHFIAISPKQDFKWTYGSSENALKFAYNCETKYIYTPEKKDIVSKKCPYKKNVYVKIEVSEKGVTFTDSACGALSAPVKLPFDNFYIFFGASQDRVEYKSHFSGFDVKSKGSGAKSLSFYGRLPYNPEVQLPSFGVQRL